MKPPTSNPPRPTEEPEYFVRGELERASDIETARVEHLWRYRFYIGEVAIIAGYGGTSKTTVAIDMTARMTTATRWPDGAHNPGGEVLWISAEDSKSKTLVPRLRAARADLTKVHFLNVKLVERTSAGETVSRKAFDLTTDCEAVEKALEAYPGIRLFILDPIASFVGASVDSHKNAEVRQALDPLIAMAQKFDVAVIGIHHFNKNESAAAINRASGSNAFVNAPRVSWQIARDKEDHAKLIFSCIKNNYGPDGAETSLSYRLADSDDPDIKVIAWDEGSPNISADEALAPVGRQRGPSREARDEAIEWIRGTLKQGDATSAQMRSWCEDTGHSWSTVKRAAKEAGVKFKPNGFGKNWIWHLATPDQN